MTESELSEIEARANAATPGPWWADDYSERRSNTPTIRVGERAKPYMTLGYCCDPEHVFSSSTRFSLAQHHRNAAFIAHARKDIPALIAEVRRLRAELDAMKLHDLKEWHRGCISRDEVRRLSERKID